MTPEQALQMLDDITSKIQLTRAGHANIQQALGTLQRVVTEHKALMASMKEKDEGA